jgi:hypothetical protein
MPRYRLSALETVSVNYFVVADNEEAAKESLLNGNYESEEAMQSNGIEEIFEITEEPS